MPTIQRTMLTRTHMEDTRAQNTLQPVVDSKAEVMDDGRCTVFKYSSSTASQLERGPVPLEISSLSISLFVPRLGLPVHVHG